MDLAVDLAQSYVEQCQNIANMAPSIKTLPRDHPAAINYWAMIDKLKAEQEELNKRAEAAAKLSAGITEAFGKAATDITTFMNKQNEEYGSNINEFYQDGVQLSGTPDETGVSFCGFKCYPIEGVDEPRRSFNMIKTVKSWVMKHVDGEDDFDYTDDHLHRFLLGLFKNMKTGAEAPTDLSELYEVVNHRRLIKSIVGYWPGETFAFYEKAVDFEMQNVTFTGKCNFTLAMPKSCLLQFKRYRQMCYNNQVPSDWMIETQLDDPANFAHCLLGYVKGDTGTTEKLASVAEVYTYVMTITELGAHYVE